jgi:hypothetical protein
VLLLLLLWLCGRLSAPDAEAGPALRLMVLWLCS